MSERRIKPTVIHIVVSGMDGRLCGAPYEHWQERYLTDEVARKLPRCPDCEAARLRLGSRSAEDVP